MQYVSILLSYEDLKMAIDSLKAFRSKLESPGELERASELANTLNEAKEKCRTVGLRKWPTEIEDDKNSDG